jgi:hypothetical protein
MEGLMNRDSAEVSKAKTAGILCIVAGVLFILNLILSAVLLRAMVDFMAGKSAPEIPGYIIPGVLLPMAVFGIFAIIGGVAAMRLTSYGWAMAGAICSIICVWFVGIFAVIYLVKGKKAFEKNTNVDMASAPPR